MSQRKAHGGRKNRRRVHRKPAQKVNGLVAPVEDVHAAPAASVARFWPSVRLFLQRVAGALGVYL